MMWFARKIGGCQKCVVVGRTIFDDIIKITTTSAPVAGALIHPIQKNCGRRGEDERKHRSLDNEEDVFDVAP